MPKESDPDSFQCQKCKRIVHHDEYLTREDFEWNKKNIGICANCYYYEECVTDRTEDY